MALAGGATALFQRLSFAFELLRQIEQGLAFVRGVAGGDHSAALRAQA